MIFTPLALDLDKPSSVQSAVSQLVKRGQPIDFLLLNAGLVPFKKRALTETGVESSQAPLIGHHQLTQFVQCQLAGANARDRYRRCRTCPRGAYPCSNTQPPRLRGQSLPR